MIDTRNRRTKLSRRAEFESLEQRLALSAPDLAPPIGPPPPPSASVVWVSTEPALQNAVANLQSGQTIVIQRGTYNLSSTLYVGNGRQVTDVTIRGETDDFDDVVVRGKGMENASYGNVPYGFWIGNAQGVTIANLSIGETYYHPVHLNAGAGAERLHIYHARIYDGGMQLVKSNPDGRGGGADDGVVEYSVLEYTAGPPATDHGGGTGYTQGVDVHTGARWVVRHNTFRNFHTPDTAAHLWNPVVLMWNYSRDALVEGNTFINTDRAVAFGLTDRADGSDHRGGIIRNNFIVMDPGLFTTWRKSRSDGQILVWDSPGSKVYHNTILTNGNTNRSIEGRWDTTGAEVRNNLADAPLGARDGSAYAQGGNYLNATPGMFLDPAAGDLHLVSNAATQAAVLDKAGTLAGAPGDWDGEGRPSGAAADIGADEWRVPPAPPPQSPPVASPDSATTVEDRAVRIAVLANDTDPDGDPLAVTAVTQGVFGSVVINADGTVTYTPSANFSGTDAFTYTISDGRGGTATAAVQVVVAEVNDAPIATGDAATTSRDTPLVIAVLANDSDPDKDILTVVGVTQGANGSVGINRDGTVTYTPMTGFVGTDSFMYTINDGRGGTVTSQVTVTVRKRRRG